MKKTRDLPIYWGLSNRSYSTYNKNMLKTSTAFKTYDPMKAWAEYQGISVQYIADPGYVGEQSFESSQFERPRFNACTNQKIYGKCVPYGMVSEVYNNTNYAEVRPFKRLGMGTVSGVSIPGLTNWAGCDAASRRAWWEMQPRFEGEVEGLNFLFELKDFKTIAKHALRFNYQNVVDTMKHAHSKVKEVQRLNRSNPGKSAYITVNSTTRAIAEARLFKSFAWDPLIRDVTTIHAQMAELVQDVQRSFMERGKSVQTRYYSETLEDDDLTVKQPRANYMFSFGFRTQKRFTATMQYLYDYKLRNATDALKQYYGLNLNAEVAWNALPFSFLVDYFYKVGPALHRMRQDPNVEPRLVQYCESVLAETSSGYHYIGDPRVSFFFCPFLKVGGTGLNNLISGYAGTSYQRKIVPPNKGAALPKFAGPSKGQWLNMAALARVFW